MAVTKSLEGIFFLHFYSQGWSHDENSRFERCGASNRFFKLEIYFRQITSVQIDDFDYFRAERGNFFDGLTDLLAPDEAVT